MSIEPTQENNKPELNKCLTKRLMIDVFKWHCTNCKAWGYLVLNGRVEVEDYEEAAEQHDSDPCEAVTKWKDQAKDPEHVEIDVEPQDFIRIDLQNPEHVDLLRLMQKREHAHAQKP